MTDRRDARCTPAVAGGGGRGQSARSLHPVQQGVFNASEGRDDMDRTTSRRRPLIVGACLMALIVPLAAEVVAGRASIQTSRGGADAEFVKRAAERAQQEVEAGKLAVRQAASAEVRAFADRMVKEHTTINAELLSLADSPSESSPPEPVVQATRTLATQAGVAFDRAYMEQSVTNHELLVTLFEEEAASGKDERLKLWAGQKLPAMREHLEIARGLRAKVAAGSAL
jgi:putative membrane protein